MNRNNIPLPSYLDSNGTEVRPGDFVAYASPSFGIRMGRVEKITSVPKFWNNPNGERQTKVSLTVGPSQYVNTVTLRNAKKTLRLGRDSVPGTWPRV